MRIPRIRHILLGAIVLVALVATAAPAEGQAWISYSAKFVCGAENPPPPGATVLARGRYKTIVDIHNPHYLIDDLELPLPVVFFKKAVLSQPQGAPVLRPSCKQQEILGADEALRMDCGTIKGLLRLSGLPSTGHLEGFVVVEVPPFQGLVAPAPELDVVAVYSAQPVAGEVSTLDVERVPATTILGSPVIDSCDPV